MQIQISHQNSEDLIIFQILQSDPEQLWFHCPYNVSFSGAASCLLMHLGIYFWLLSEIFWLFVHILRRQVRNCDGCSGKDSDSQQCFLGERSSRGERAGMHASGAASAVPCRWATTALSRPLSRRQAISPLLFTALHNAPTLPRSQQTRAVSIPQNYELWIPVLFYLL